MVYLFSWEGSRLCQALGRTRILTSRSSPHSLKLANGICFESTKTLDETPRRNVTHAPTPRAPSFCFAGVAPPRVLSIHVGFASAVHHCEGEFRTVYRLQRMVPSAPRDTCEGWYPAPAQSGCAELDLLQVDNSQSCIVLGLSSKLHQFRIPAVEAVYSSAVSHRQIPASTAFSSTAAVTWSSCSLLLVWAFDCHACSKKESSWKQSTLQRMPLC